MIELKSLVCSRDFFHFRVLILAAQSESEQNKPLHGLIQKHIKSCNDLYISIIITTLGLPIPDPEPAEPEMKKDDETQTRFSSQDPSEA